MAKQTLTLRKLKEDERISESGFYNIHNDIYHSDCANAPSVSSSSLITLDTDPRQYWDTSIYNKDREETKKQDYFNFGHAAHEMILNGDLPEDEYAVRPAKYKTWRGQDAQFWKTAREKEGLKVLTLEDLDNLVGMAEAIQSHPEAGEIFKSGLVEASMFVKHQDIYVKARPDIIPLRNAAIIQDYKTTTSVNRVSLGYEIKKHQYDAKLANVYWCMKQLLPDAVPGMDDDAIDMTFSLIFQKKTRPWSINIVPIAKMQIMLRMAQNLAAIDIFANGMRTNDWPHMYVDYDNHYEMRPYEADQLKDKISAGQYPTLDPNTLLPMESN